MLKMGRSTATVSDRVGYVRLALERDDIDDLGKLHIFAAVVDAWREALVDEFISFDPPTFYDIDRTAQFVASGVLPADQLPDQSPAAETAERTALRLLVSTIDDFLVMVRGECGSSILENVDGELLDARLQYSRELLSVSPSRAETGGPEYTNREMALQCEIRDGRLILEIGIDTLAFATKESPELYRRYGYDYLAGQERKDFVKINDPNLWAKEVRSQIIDEAEDGSSLMTKLIDSAIEQAIDDGAEGVDIPLIGLVDDHDE